MLIISCWLAGWVKGRNRETQFEGYFLGECVKYLPTPVPRPRSSIIGNDIFDYFLHLVSCNHRSPKVLFAFSALTPLVRQQEGHPACEKMGGWWRWALVGTDGVAPSLMVGVSASVNLPLHHKVQKFSSGTG